MSDHWKTNQYQSEENLKQQLEEIKRKADRLIEEGSKIKTEGSFIGDFANYALGNIPSPPTPAMYSAMSGLNNTLDNILGFLSNASMGTATGIAFHGTQTISAFGSAILSYDAIQHPESEYSKSTTSKHLAWEGFNQLTNHPFIRQEVLQQMQRLNLDQSPTNKNAIKQIETAWNIHLETPLSATPSLLTLRSAIDQIIDELVKRRPIQQEIPKGNKNQNKIIEIGTQLRADYTDKSTFEQLGVEWAILHDKLSEGKKGQENRQAERDLMRRATQFLQKLLTAIDAQKLRPYR